MFSSLNEAWDHNPVKEITNKLTSGEFNKSQTDPTEIYKFSSGPASDSSLNLLSEDMSVGQNMQTKYSSCSPVKFKSNAKLKPKPILKAEPRNAIGIEPDTNSIDFSEFETTAMDETTSPVRMIDSKCTYTVRHLDKCPRCADKLNRLIDKKVKEKVNDMFLDFNLNQLRMAHTNHQPPVSESTSSKSDSWKETLIIVVGTIIAILIIFLITKCFK
jgi:hypothetical protein